MIEGIAQPLQNQAALQFESTQQTQGLFGELGYRAGSRKRFIKLEHTDSNPRFIITTLQGYNAQALYEKGLSDAYSWGNCV